MSILQLFRLFAGMTRHTGQCLNEHGVHPGPFSLSDTSQKPARFASRGCGQQVGQRSPAACLYPACPHLYLRVSICTAAMLPLPSTSVVVCNASPLTRNVARRLSRSGALLPAPSLPLPLGEGRGEGLPRNRPRPPTPTLPLPLGEGRGEGLPRNRPRPPTPTVCIVTLLDACELVRAVRIISISPAAFCRRHAAGSLQVRHSTKCRAAAPGSNSWDSRGCWPHCWKHGDLE